MFAVEAATGGYAQYIVKGLAVLGGFLAGTVATGGLARMASKAYFRKKQPEGAIRVMKGGGGVASAVLVALILFGTGEGSGLFSPGGDSRGNAGKSSVADSASKEKNDLPTPKDKTPPELKKTDGKPGDPKNQGTGEPLLIEVLDVARGGEGKVYRLVKDRTTHTLREMTTLLETHQRSGGLRDGVIVRYYPESGAIETSRLLDEIERIGIDRVLRDKLPGMPQE